MGKVSIMKDDLIKEALVSIAEANNGYLKPEDVVKAAQSPDSPMHDRFQWDDTEAARHYRNIQAGVLIRMIKITVMRNSTKTKQLEVITTRAFGSLPSDRDTKNGDTDSAGSYQPVESIMAEPEKRDELLRTVLKELEAYRKRYAAIAELAEVWAALDRVA